MENTAQNLYNPTNVNDETEYEERRGVADYLMIGIGIMITIFVLVFVFFAGVWYAEANMNRVLIQQQAKIK